MVYSGRVIVIYFLWIFKVMGLDLCCPARHVLCRLPFPPVGYHRDTELFFMIEDTECTEDSFFVFLRHRVLLKTGLIKNVQPLTISS